MLFLEDRTRNEVQAVTVVTLLARVTHTHERRRRRAFEERQLLAV